MKRERRPEDQLTDQILAACGALPGVLLLDTRHVGKYARVYAAGYGPPVQIGRPGQPDMIALVDGKAVGLELKSAKGRLETSQVQCHAAWRMCGTPIAVVRSVDEALMAIECRRQA